jgi:hypothetical protein
MEREGKEQRKRKEAVLEGAPTLVPVASVTGTGL